MTTETENVQMEITNSNEQPEVKPEVQPEVQQSQIRQIDFSKSVTTTIGLLVNLRQIIDASISRGTYKGNELTQVGQVYDQLTNVINTCVNE